VGSQQRTLPISPYLRAVLNFTPSWYSVSMGTGILSILLHTSPHRFPGEATIGTVLYFVNIALFVAFTAVSAARYVLYPWALGRMLRHPAQSLFLGTIPMALATIVNATVLIAVPMYGRWAAHLCWALWWVDVALSVASTFGIPLLMFQMHELTLEAMSAAWLLPIVPAVVCAASGGTVAGVLSVENAQITLFLSYVLWGIGMTLSLLVMAVYFHRLAVHKLPNSEVIVSAFLPLGPCGQGVFGLLQIAKVGRRVFAETDLAGVGGSGDIVLVVSLVGGFMIWGLGLWWLLHGVACVTIRMLAARLRFNMGFWGFIFPLGVFIAGTISLGDLLSSAFFSYLSVVLLGLLVVLYIAIALKTAAGAYNQTLLVAPCMSDLIKG